MPPTQANNSPFHRRDPFRKALLLGLVGAKAHHRGKLPLGSQSGRPWGIACRHRVEGNAWRANWNLLSQHNQGNEHNVEAYHSRLGGVEGEDGRCRANTAHIRQSRPDSGRGFQVKFPKTF